MYVTAFCRLHYAEITASLGAFYLEFSLEMTSNLIESSATIMTLICSYKNYVDRFPDNESYCISVINPVDKFDILLIHRQIKIPNILILLLNLYELLRLTSCIQLLNCSLLSTFPYT